MLRVEFGSDDGFAVDLDFRCARVPHELSLKFWLLVFRHTSGLRTTGGDPQVPQRSPDYLERFSIRPKQITQIKNARAPGPGIAPQVARYRDLLELRSSAV